MHFSDDLVRFVPLNDQEKNDKKAMLSAILKDGESVLFRENLLYHMTGSSIIVNKDKTKTLMAYHNIYQSWAWTGGHADGETDLMRLAIREAREETGIQTLTPISDAPISCEILHVLPHMKKGKYVGLHLHFNLTYALIGDESEPLTVKADENTRVGWLPIDRLGEFVSEPFMIPIYQKILGRIV
ncbi:MAG: NUDIX hydrolase [Clostridia bacterium]|nr:NUDIX hydrolase [Clostridia bacterium]